MPIPYPSDAELAAVIATIKQKLDCDRYAPRLEPFRSALAKARATIRAEAGGAASAVAFGSVCRKPARKGAALTMDKLKDFLWPVVLIGGFGALIDFLIGRAGQAKAKDFMLRWWVR